MGLLCMGRFAAFSSFVVACSLVVGCGGSADGSADGSAAGGTLGSGGTTNGIAGTPAKDGAGAAVATGGRSGSAAGTLNGTGGISAASAPTSTADCGSFTPCGGNVVGTWNLVRFCIGTDAFGGTTSLPAECAGIVKSVDVNAAETFTFLADGTVTTDAQAGSMAMTYVYTSACLNATSGTSVTAENLVTTCSGLSVAFAAAGMTASAGSITPCTASGDNCVCNLLKDIPQNSATDTYTTSGSNLITTASKDGKVTRDTYCVSGNTLQIGSATSGAYIVFSK